MRIKSDCQTCGLCCLQLINQDTFCDVSEQDIAKLDPKWVERNVVFFPAWERLVAEMDGSYIPQAAIKTQWRKMKTGPCRGYDLCACVALRGAVLHQVSCEVYEVRPQTCRRAVIPGDPTCHKVRKLFTEFLASHGVQLV